MSDNKIKKIIENKISVFKSDEPDFSLLAKCKQLITDYSYFNFILESNNGGYFYEQSLHIYSYSHRFDFNDIEYVNALLKQEYGEIINGLLAFGEDVFGNQFCFDTINNNTIIFFDSETGEKTVIATGFINWVQVLQDRLEYYTGINILREWNLNSPLEINQRLFPKKPFVMGGDFTVNNLYSAAFPSYIKAYANIARQIYNLPEGTPVKLVIDKK